MSKELIYPHYLSFISNDKCDICNSNQNVSTFPLDHTNILGWYCCDKYDCTNTLVQWQNVSIIQKNRLESEFGNNLKILRSKGFLDTGWIIKNNAYYDKKYDKWWVNVYRKNRRLTKTVLLSDLRNWN